MSGRNEREEEEEEEEEREPYVPFSKRSEWKDVEPLVQDDGPEPVCKIAYSEQFVETMNYFRAVLQKDERSPRALQLTSEVIKLNPANYTAWYFRRLLLEALEEKWSKELLFVSKIGRENPKNYQIWFHRRMVVEKMQDFSEELKYTAAHLQEDSKNYHAWAHRQWVIASTGWWEQELQFTEQLLKEDLRNNSAWNQRHFVVTRNKTQTITQESREREMHYTFQLIKKLPNNQSPWNYLRGLFCNDEYSVELQQLCETFREGHRTSPHAASLLVEIYEQKGTTEWKRKAIELCEELETRLDNIHRKYWIFKRNQLQ